MRRWWILLPAVLVYCSPGGNANPADPSVSLKPEVYEPSLPAETSPPQGSVVAPPPQGTEVPFSDLCMRSLVRRTRTRVDGIVPCTPDDLLPGLGDDYVDSWVYANSSDEMPTAGLPTYNCTCPYYKAGYFCPHAKTHYPRWEPPAETAGSCQAVSDEVLAEGPFPPSTKLFFYGNSHLRQTVESALCMFKSTIKERHCTTGAINPIFLKPSRSEGFDGKFRKVGITRQCRGFYKHGDFHRKWLEAAPCISNGDVKAAFSCDDSLSHTVFHNNAEMDYYFAHQQLNKSVMDGLELLGQPASHYSMAFVNSGNHPPMEIENVLDAARLFNEAGVPFFWVTTYDGGRNDLRNWDEEDQEAFFSANARQISVHSMTRGTEEFLQRATEGNVDPHYCLPGPPNEMARLVLKIAWSVEIERNGVR